MTETDPRPKIIVLTGPTAVGKTGLSLKLARVFGARIVNADSLQVYRHLDIGTAKPTPAEQAAAVHYLLDVVDPDQDFDAAAYLNLARPLIERLHRRGVPVLVVGGTGLYLRSLVKGLFPGPGGDEAVRDRFKELARREGRQALHRRLAEVDPEAAARLHPHDVFRVVRALEVHELTGRSLSDFHADHALGEAPYQTLFFCLNLPRPELYERIERRTDEMFAAGLVEETAAVLERGFSPDLKPLQAIGYRQAAALLQGKMTEAQARAEVKTQTRRLAKRQLTWFRAQPEAVWVSPGDEAEVTASAGRFWEGRG